jgi:hypothetical protein
MNLRGAGDCEWSRAAAAGMLRAICRAGLGVYRGPSFKSPTGHLWPSWRLFHGDCRWS